MWRKHSVPVPHHGNSPLRQGTLLSIFNSTSISKTYAIPGEALFGANVKDNKAKVRIEFVPIPPVE